MEEYRSVEKLMRKKNNNYKNKNNTHKQFKKIVNKILITVLIFLTVLILSKDKGINEYLKKEIFNNNFNFASFYNNYNKYFGNILPFKSKNPVDQTVFNEKLTYNSLNIYKEGVELKVDKNYLVPVLESGIIVFIGEKEGYGKTIIVQQVNGVDLWYSNVEFNNLKLYDYISKGTLLGEAKTDSMYLVFQKEGKFLNYKEFLA